MKTTDIGLSSTSSNSERSAWYKEQKRLKRASQKYRSEKRRREENIHDISNREQKTEQRKTIESGKRQKRRERAKYKLNKNKEYERNRKSVWRSKQRTSANLSVDIADTRLIANPFKYRMTKKRAIQRLRNALPATPTKRPAVIAGYLNGQHNSPTVKKLRQSKITVSPDEIKQNQIAHSALKNMKEMLKHNKQKRSRNKRMEVNTLIASVSGEDLTEKKVKVKLATRLGISVKRVSGGQRLRNKVMKTEISCWEYTKRKTRSDGLSDETKKIVYTFWKSPGVSRPTGNKNDVKRHRIGPKSYISHPIQILEKTQTEIFHDFTVAYPSIKISQRSFEKYKPFFIKPVRPRDKCTCCCRYHVEFGHAYRRCMQLRSAIHKRNGEMADIETYPVFEHSSELIAETMCEVPDGQTFFKKACVNRECDRCGVQPNLFMESELDCSDNAEEVEWEKYEYQTLKGKGTKMRRKLVLVKKRTKIGILFKNLITLLETFPSHNFRAEWQSKQAKAVIEHLPEGDIVAIHDFSENYKCIEKNEIQSSYFQKTEVSIHVTILHRHAVLEYDGFESTRDDPKIIQEQFFVISPDVKHDHHFTFYAQQMLHEYLMKMSYPLKTVHEFTDGCAAQYKSRHCMGSVNIAASQFGCNIIRNYFETSHAKGPQDAAGGLLKQQADLAVLRGRQIIQSAQDFYEFVESNLKTPKESASCKSRIFRYVEEIPRQTAGYFQPIPAIRSIHQLQSSPLNCIAVRNLSCYTCEECSDGNYQKCENTDLIDTIRKVNLVRDKVCSDDKELGECDEGLTLSDLIMENHILAVRAVDEEYYLFQVGRKPFVLDTDTCDDYQTTYRAGTNVMEGCYFERKKNSPLTYRLLPKHKAIIPTQSVLYICSEICSGNVVKIPENVHQIVLQILGDSE